VFDLRRARRLIADRPERVVVPVETPLMRMGRNTRVITEVTQFMAENGDEFVCPVQVLEHEHRRPLLGERLEEATPGRERLAAAARGASGAVAGGAGTSG
jgi:hypothetical protein